MRVIHVVFPINNDDDNDDITITISSGGSSSSILTRSSLFYMHPVRKNRKPKCFLYFFFKTQLILTKFGAQYSK